MKRGRERRSSLSLEKTVREERGEERGIANGEKPVGTRKEVSREKRVLSARERISSFTIGTSGTGIFEVCKNGGKNRRKQKKR